MSVDYKIRSFDKVNGSIVVEFADFPLFNIDLPVDGGKYPEGEALDTYIRGFLPVWVLERKQIIQNGIANETSIEALVEPPPQPEPVATANSEAAVAQEEIIADWEK